MSPITHVWERSISVNLLSEFKNDSIILATTKMCLDGQNSVPKKIKKKIIQHAIDNPYDFFDYEYLSSY